MPQPLSWIWRSWRPPPLTTTWIAVAFASMLFSSISLSADDGRCTTSPAAMRFTTASSSREMRAGGPEAALEDAAIRVRSEGRETRGKSSTTQTRGREAKKVGLDSIGRLNAREEGWRRRRRRRRRSLQVHIDHIHARATTNASKKGPPSHHHTPTTPIRSHHSRLRPPPPAAPGPSASLVDPATSAAGSLVASVPTGSPLRRLKKRRVSAGDISWKARPFAPLRRASSHWQTAIECLHCAGGERSKPRRREGARREPATAWRCRAPGQIAGSDSCMVHSVTHQVFGSVGVDRGAGSTLEVDDAVRPVHDEERLARPRGPVRGDGPRHRTRRSPKTRVGGPERVHEALRRRRACASARSPRSRNPDSRRSGAHRDPRARVLAAQTDPVE